MALLKKLYNPPHARRIYQPYIATYNIIALEMEFESLEECERYLKEAYAVPGAIALAEEADNLREAVATCEIWKLEE